MDTPEGNNEIEMCRSSEGGGPREDVIIDSTYRLGEVIGRGGRATIYRARSLHLQDDVAIKIWHDHVLSGNSEDKFKAEARIAARLDHPNIVRVRSFGYDKGLPYLVMEYLEGESLEQLVRRGGPLDISRFMMIFKCICKALHYAHEKNVLHRDLKPANIMICALHANSSSTLVSAKLLDFGMARIVDDTNLACTGDSTRTGSIAGSPAYMSPEQCQQSRKLDARSDIYSLGCTMFEAITGSPPFLAETELAVMSMHVNETPQIPQNIQISSELKNLVLKCLEKVPSNRFQSCSQILSRLNGMDTESLRSDPTPYVTVNAKTWVCRVLVLLIPIVVLCGLIAKRNYTAEGNAHLKSDDDEWKEVRAGSEKDEFEKTKKRRIGKLSAEAALLAAGEKEVSSPKEAMMLYLYALEAAEKKTSLSLKANANVLCAQQEFRLKLYEDARHHLDKAHRFLNEDKTNELGAVLQTRIWRCEAQYFQYGPAVDFSRAESALRESLKSVDSSSEYNDATVSLKGDIYQDLGTLYDQAGMTQAAINAFKNSIKLAPPEYNMLGMKRDTRDVLGRRWILLADSCWNVDLPTYANALERYKGLKPCGNDTGNRLNMLARKFLVQGKYDEASNLAQLALGEFNASHARDKEHAFTFLTLGEIANGRSQFKEARIYASRGLRMLLSGPEEGTETEASVKSALLNLSTVASSAEERKDLTSRDMKR